MDASTLLSHAAVSRHIPGRPQHRGNLKQFPCVQHPAQRSPLKGRSHRTQVGQGWCAVNIHHIPSRSSLLKQQRHLVLIYRGADLFHPLLRLVADRLSRQQRQYRRKFQCIK